MSDLDLEPAVSILIPVYKVEGYIERCARSIFEQTYKNIEYIFVDTHHTFPGEQRFGHRA